MSFPQTSELTQPHQLARSRRYRLGDYASGPALPYVNDWLGRIGIATSGSIPSMKTILCITDLVNGLLLDGVWQKLLVVSAYAPDNFTQLTIPLLNVANSAFATWQTFGGWNPGTDLGINGLTGNGSGKYLNTGFNTLTGFPGGAQSSSLIFYTFAVTHTGFSGGAYGTTGIYLGSQFTDLNAYDSNGSISPLNNEITVNPSPGAGYYCGSRISSTDHRFYFANSSNAHAQIGATDSTAFVGNFANIPIYVHCLDNTGAGAQLFTADTISFFAIGQGLTATDSSNAFNRIQAYRKSLGGGFV